MELASITLLQKLATICNELHTPTPQLPTTNDIYVAPIAVDPINVLRSQCISEPSLYQCNKIIRVAIHLRQIPAPSALFLYNASTAPCPPPP